MAYALIANIGADGTANGVTSGGINTSGANLLVVGVAWFPGITVDGTMSDLVGGNSNTWTPVTKRTSGGVLSCQLFWTVPTFVGSGHTFSYDGTSIFPSLRVSAWSGSTASPFDQENGTTATGSTTIAHNGGFTPSEDECLIVSALSAASLAGSFAIDGGFTITDSNEFSGGNNEGGSMAYLIQTTAAASNPTWTVGNAIDLGASMASFLAGEAPTGVTYILT